MIDSVKENVNIYNKYNNDHYLEKILYYTFIYVRELTLKINYYQYIIHLYLNNIMPIK